MSETPLLLPVVEGEGETYAVPLLLRRVCAELLDIFHVDVRAPWRLPRGQMTQPQQLARVLTVLRSATKGRRGGVLLILDQDDDECPVQLAEELRSGIDIDVPIEVVVACREFEAWFLAAVESLRARRDVKDDARYDRDPESPRDAKGRLRDLMEEPYRETLHQAAFCGAVDLRVAHQRSRSFRRLVSATQALASGTQRVG